MPMAYSVQGEEDHGKFCYTRIGLLNQALFGTLRDLAFPVPGLRSIFWSGVAGV